MSDRSNEGAMYNLNMSMWVGTAVAAWLTACVACAQERSPQEIEAQAEFETAEGHYDAQRWALAAEAYQRSFDLLEQIAHPRRGLVAFNVGRSLEQLPGREADALTAYRRAVGLMDDPANAEERRTAEARIAEIELRLGGMMSPVGPVLLGVGGALLLAGIGTGIASLLLQNEILAQCTDATCPTRLRGAASDLEALTITTDVLIPVSVVAMGIGLVLALVLKEARPSAQQGHVRIGAAFAANGAYLSLGMEL
jgi:hypothetical protein